MLVVPLLDIDPSTINESMSDEEKTRLWLLAVGMIGERHQEEVRLRREAQKEQRRAEKERLKERHAAEATA